MKRILILMLLTLTLASVAYGRTGSGAMLLADTTNVSGTVYYPSSAGETDFNNADHLSILMACASGVTVTVEIRAQFDSTVWVDVTKSGTSLNNGATGYASFADKTDRVDFDDLYGIAAWRVKVVGDSSNTVHIEALQARRLD